MSCHLQESIWHTMRPQSRIPNAPGMCGHRTRDSPLPGATYKEKIAVMMIFRSESSTVAAAMSTHRRVLELDGLFLPPTNS